MGIYNSLMDQLTDKGALFNVSTDKLVTLGGIEVPNKKCIINEHNGEVIGIVGDKYKVVPNEEIFDAFCKSVEAADIDWADASVNVGFSKGGARTIVDFVFPNESIQINGDGSETVLSITSLNSFDGSTRFYTKAGGLRMKCLNGQILGDVVASYSSVHNQKLDIEQGAATVVQMLQDFRGAEEYWSNMMKVFVSDETATKVIIEFFNREDAEDPFNKNVVVVRDLWKTYSKEMGRNAYALYNALTDWVTHKESKSGASGRLMRERRLSKALSSIDVFDTIPQAIAA